MDGCSGKHAPSWGVDLWKACPASQGGTAGNDGERHRTTHCQGEAAILVVHSRYHDLCLVASHCILLAQQADEATTEKTTRRQANGGQSQKIRDGGGENPLLHQYQPRLEDTFGIGDGSN